MWNSFAEGVGSVFDTVVMTGIARSPPPRRLLSSGSPPRIADDRLRLSG
jgi:hypothetical protein